MKARQILEAGIGHVRDRAATYDKPEGERSMNATVNAFYSVTGLAMTEEQGWLFMALLKAVRSQQGAFRADSYEDGAAYFALAGEAAHADRNPSPEWQEVREAAFLRATCGEVRQFDPAVTPKAEDFNGEWPDETRRQDAAAEDEAFAAIPPYTGQGGVMIQCPGCTATSCECRP